MECYINTENGRSTRHIMACNTNDDDDDDDNDGDDDDDGTSKRTVSKPREIDFCFKISLIYRISQLLK